MDTGRLAVRYKANPAGGRHLESQPAGTIDATTTAATHPRLNQARMCLVGRSLLRNAQVLVSAPLTPIADDCSVVVVFVTH